MRTGRLLTASLFLVSCNAMDNSNLKHLIGDHRFEEFYEMNADMKKLSTGVAVMMNDGFPGSDDSFFRSDKKSKRAVNPGFIVNKNSALTMGEEVENSYKKTFCKDEPKYVNQPTIGVCSVFLIGPAMVATAGHCVSEMLGGSTDLASLFSGGISDLRIVFDVQYKDKDQSDISVKSESVYRVSNIIYHSYKADDETPDFAILLLDRNVTGNRHIFELDWEGKTEVKDSLTVLGFPWGIPLKGSDKGVIYEIKDKTFIAKVDAMGGNSGSMVYNQKLNKVIGILTAGRSNIGEFNYDMNGDCMRITRLKDNDVNAMDRIDRMDTILASLPFFVKDVIKNRMPIPADQEKKYQGLLSKDPLRTEDSIRLYKALEVVPPKEGEEEESDYNFVDASDLASKEGNEPEYIELKLLDDVLYPRGERERDAEDDNSWTIDVSYFLKVEILNDESGDFKGKTFYLPYSEYIEIRFPEKE